jgi:hypothetical protein
LILPYSLSQLAQDDHALAGHKIGHLTRPSVVRLPVGKIPILLAPKPFANIDIRRRADTTALLSSDAFKQDGHCSETPASPADAVRGWLGEAPWSVHV